MANLEFKKYNFAATVTFISENGAIADFDKLESEIRTDIEDVIADIIDECNNVVKVELLQTTECGDEL